MKPILTKEIKVGNLRLGGKNPIFLIAGPCVIEDEKTTFQTARYLKQLTQQLKIPLVFKSSYDKANRTSIEHYRGPGLEKGLKILARIKKELQIPILSDVHCRNEIGPAAEVLDIIQVPAYLCQQTDMVVEAAKTGRVLNIKKGQFIAPWDISRIVGKAKSTGNDKIILTERGATFGYNNLVFDIRAIPIMQEIGYPVVADITHMLRIPGPTSQESAGGQPKFIPMLAKAAVAAGCDGLFLEVHPDPKNALCDAASQLALNKLEALLKQIKQISQIVRKI